MAANWETIHVFISSTFNDMHAERDLLVKRVFPDLRAWCEQRKLRLIDVDLRWGVTEQDAENNRNVVNVCLRRIDDCRPFFLCFLGQRRGWVPTGADVSPDTHRAFPGLASEIGKASVTEIEILHALLCPFHRPGTGAAPCRHAFFYFRDPSYLADIGDAIVRGVYATPGAVDGARGEDAMLREWRERIAALSGRSVRSYTAGFDPGASTPELALSFECSSQTASARERWLRAWRQAGVDLPHDALVIPPDSALADKARLFNQRLTAGRLSGFRCPDPPHADLAEVILDDLKRTITERYPGRGEVRTPGDSERDRDQQSLFLLSCGEGFMSRAGDFEELDAYVDGDSTRLFCLAAPAGMGKSSLLANWVEHCRRRFASASEARVFARFIGASDQSVDTISLLRQLVLEFQEHGLKQLPLDSPAQVYAAFEQYLVEMGRGGKTILVLDAVDQLESGLRDLHWLPKRLPGNVRLVVSFKTDPEAGDERIEGFLAEWSPVRATVRPLVSEADRRRLIDSYTALYLKQLDEPHVQALVHAEGSANPLYLKVVLSELRVFGAFAGLGEKIRRDFGPTPRTAFLAVLRRLERDPAYSTLQMQRFVPIVFGLLSHARQGLGVDELTDLVMGEYPWPQATTAGNPAEERSRAIRDALNLLFRQVSSFLESRLGRVDFFYEAFRLAAVDYSTEPAGRPAVEWHRTLARYFHGRAQSTREDAETSEWCQIRIRDNLQVLVQRRLANAILGTLSESTDDGLPGSDGPDDSDDAGIEGILSSVIQDCSDILGIPLRRAAEVITTVWSEGSCVAAEVRRSEADAVVALLARAGIRAEIEPLAPSATGVWNARAPRALAEMLFHAARGELWELGVRVLCDARYQQALVQAAGHLTFIVRFRQFTERLKSASGARDWLHRLYDEMPINPLTRPLLEDLACGEGSDVRTAFEHLERALESGRDAERALIPFRGLLAVIGDQGLTPEREPLRLIWPRLLLSPNIRIAWLAAAEYWAVVPGGDPKPLLTLALAERAHPLARAQAAQELGESDDLGLVPDLERLARGAPFPVGEMAARSARLILASHHRLDPDGIDDWTQPNEMPSDLTPLLEAIRAVGASVDTSRLSDKRPLILGLVEPSLDTFDMKWKVNQVLLLLLRQLPCRIICVEGSWSDVTLEEARLGATDAGWRRAASRFLWDGIISSEEYLNLTTSYPFRLLGIDNRDLYETATVEKYRGQVGTGAVASVARASGMVDNCFRWLARYPSEVVVVLTKVLPGFMIGRLLGLEVDAAEAMFESMLGERVTKRHPRAADCSYVKINLAGLDESPDPAFDWDPHVQHLRSNPLAMKDFREGRATPGGTDDNSGKAEKALRRPDSREREHLSGKRMRGSTFDSLDLRGLDLSSADACQANCSGADVSGASLRGTNLHGVRMDDAIGRESDFREANLFEARLERADLSGSDLSEALLVGAALTDARLNRACLRGANLHGANLRGASLVGCDLTGTDLRKTVLMGADLRETDLSVARLERARFDPGTRFPGPVPAGRGMQLIDPPIRSEWIQALPHNSRLGLERANFAVINRLHGHERGAKEEIETAIRLWETDLGHDTHEMAASLTALVRALQDSGFHTDALPLCRQAVAIWRRIEKLHHLHIGLNNLGLTLCQMGQLDEAEQVLLEAVGLDPKSPYPCYWLARVYGSRRRDYDGPREANMWQRYLELGGTSEERRREAEQRLQELGFAP